MKTSHMIVALLGVLLPIAAPRPALADHGEELARASLRAVAMMQEDYYVNYEMYKSCRNKVCQDLGWDGSMGFTHLCGVYTEVVAVGDKRFVAKSFHVNSPVRKFYWDNQADGREGDASEELVGLFPPEGPLAEASQDCTEEVAQAGTDQPVAAATPPKASSPEDAAHEKVVQSMRDVATLQEVQFADNESYKTCGDRECGALAPGVSLPQELPKEIRIAVVATDVAFVGWAWHEQYPDRVVYWDNQSGGLLAEPNERVRRALAETEAINAKITAENSAVPASDEKPSM